MLTDDVRASLLEPIDQRFADDPREVVACTLKQKGGFGQEGLLALDERRIVFAHTDFVRGVVALEWTRAQLSDLRVDDGFLGREIIGDGPAGELTIKCRRAEELAPLEAALERLGWFGADPPEPAAPAPPLAAVTPTPAVDVPPAPAPPASVESVFFGTVSAPEPPPPPIAPEPPPPAFDVAVEESPDPLSRIGVDLEFVEAGSDDPTPPPPPAEDEVVCVLCGRLNEPHFAYCLSCGGRLVTDPTAAGGGVALLGLKGAVAGQMFQIGSDVTIGRAADNDVPIPMVSLSRRHARIVQEGSDWILVDLASSNGTRHNDRTITGPTSLAEGDRIGFGDDCELLFVPGRLAAAVSDMADARPDAPKPHAIAAIAVLVGLAVLGVVAYLLAAPS